jgi:arginyl-tRNA synthetase
LISLDFGQYADINSGAFVDLLKSSNVWAKEGDDMALKSFRTTMKASVQLRRSDGTTFYFNYPEDADDP